MKKIPFIFITLFGLVGCIKSTTEVTKINAQVYDYVKGKPLKNVKIYLAKKEGQIFQALYNVIKDSTITDNNGYFSFSLPTGTQGNYEIMTYNNNTANYPLNFIKDPEKLEPQIKMGNVNNFVLPVREFSILKLRTNIIANPNPNFQINVSPLSFIDWWDNKTLNGGNLDATSYFKVFAQRQHNILFSVSPTKRKIENVYIGLSDTTFYEREIDTSTW